MNGIIRTTTEKRQTITHSWNIPGVYFVEEQALVYNLAAAYEPKTRGRMAREEAATAAAESYPMEVTTTPHEAGTPYDRYFRSSEAGF